MITSEQWGTVRAELEKLLKLKQKADEPLQDYAVRLAKAAGNPQKVTDEMWAELSEDPTQNWVNAANEAIEKGGAINLPEGSDGQTDGGAAPAARKGGSSKKASSGAVAKSAKAETSAKTSAKAAKTPAKTPAKADGQRGRPSKHDDSEVITLKTSENPHRKGSSDFDKFKKLKDGQTIEKAIKAGVDRPYLRYLEERRGLITIAPAAA